MPQMRKARTPGSRMHNYAEAIQSTSTTLATNKKNVPWQGRQQIREIDIESVPEQSGNEECPQ